MLLWLSHHPSARQFKITVCSVWKFHISLVRLSSCFFFLVNIQSVLQCYFSVWCHWYEQPGCSLVQALLSYHQNALLWLNLHIWTVWGNVAFVLRSLHYTVRFLWLLNPLLNHLLVNSDGMSDRVNRAQCIVVKFLPTYISSNTAY